MAHPERAIPLIVRGGEVRAIVRARPVERLSWALYDLLNTSLSMNVAALCFAVWPVDEHGVSNTIDAIAHAIAAALA